MLTKTFEFKRWPDEFDQALLIEINKPMPPTYRELAKVIMRSLGTVQQRLRWLEKEGYIERMKNPGQARAIKITDKGKMILGIGKKA